MTPRTHSSGSSTGCWRRRATANAGAGTGSTWPVTPTRRATLEDDHVRAYAYKYRDYVIRCLNADRPFDQFIREQVAGDEMLRPPYRDLPPADLDKLIATGFLRMAPDGTASGGVDPTIARNQVVSDTLKIVSTSLLGLTVGCAQCHDHRYDPIPQEDYYRLRAVFEPAYDVKNWRPPAARRVSLYTEADRRESARIEAEAARIDKERLEKLRQYIEATFAKELAKLPETVREKARAAHAVPPAKRTAEQQQLLKEYPSLNVTDGSLYLYDSKAAAELKKIADRAAAVRAKKPVEDFVPALTEIPGRVPATFLFHRGDLRQPRQAVAPGALTVLDGVPLHVVKDAAAPTTGRRLALARWLTDPRQPLTARVLVNRVWMHHFGRGIVGTPGDFGKLGERPTHPELLDWLASELSSAGLETEGPAPADDDLVRLPAVVAPDVHAAQDRPGQSAAWPDVAAAAGGGVHPRLHSGD